MELGYFTKYGDGAVDIEPIAHLYKTEIFDLASYLNIPQRIIDQKPSAGLWKGQTDEDEIGMSYSDMDKILVNYPKYVARVKDLAEKEKIIQQWRNSTKHKRRMPAQLERSVE